MNFICCCRKISRLKKDKDKDSNNSFINSEVSKNRTCNIFENITRTNSNLSIIFF